MAHRCYCWAKLLAMLYMRAKIRLMQACLISNDASLGIAVSGAASSWFLTPTLRGQNRGVSHPNEAKDAKKNIGNAG